MVDQDAGVVGGGESAQDLSELGGAEFARSTGTEDPLRQAQDAGPLVFHTRYYANRGRGPATTPAADVAFSPMSHWPWK